MKIIVPPGESLVVEFQGRDGIYVDITHREKEVKIAINSDPLSIDTEDDTVQTITFADPEPKGLQYIPSKDDWLTADHPITCLNPDRYFRLKEWREKGLSSPFSVRGRSTCWFGSNGVNLVKDVKVREAGFDITRFNGPEDFKAIMERFNLDYLGTNEENNGSFRFSGPNLSIHTTNHPIQGDYCRPEQRDNDPGFAAYIGIVGEESEVEECVKMIKERARFFKAFSPNSRDYI